MPEENGTGLKVRVTRWDREEPPAEHEIYARMEATGLPHLLRSIPAGTREQAHQHPYPELVWVISGYVRYGFAGGDGGMASQVLLKAGDRIELPPNFPHAVDVPGAEFAVYFSGSPFSLPPAHHPSNVDI